MSKWKDMVRPENEKAVYAALAVLCEFGNSVEDMTARRDCKTGVISFTVKFDTIFHSQAFQIMFKEELGKRGVKGVRCFRNRHEFTFKKA